MSNFDVAIGLDATAINGVINQLFSNPTLKSKIFQGTVNKTIAPLGDVSLTYTVNNAPTATLAAPSEADWKKALPTGGTYPTSNAFQLSFASVTVKFTVAGAAPVTATGSISIYGVASVANDTLNMSVDKVLLDETNFSAVDQLIVNGIIIPQALAQANSMLAGITIPRIPVFNQKIDNKTVKVEFQSAVAGIISGQLIMATSIDGDPAPSLTGYTPPALTGIYLLSNLNPINKVLATLANGFNTSGNPKTGGKAFNAEASYSITIKTAQMQLSGGTLAIALTLEDITASAGVGGIGTAIAKTLLCPIDTAVQAAEGKPIDKITAVVSATISPSPVPIAFTLSAKTVGTEQDAQISIGTVNDVRVTLKPEWSSIIGSTFAAGASAIMDLLTTQIQDAIMNAIIKGHLQNMTIMSIPHFSKTIEGITVTPTLNDGDLKIIDNMISSSFKVTLS